MSQNVFSGLRVGIASAFLVIAFLAGIWDIYVLAKGRPQDTISSTVQEWSREFQVLPFALGFLACHLLGGIHRLSGG